MASGSNIGSRDSAWKYCTHMEENRNSTVSNYCGLVIRSGRITCFKYHLSHSDPHSNTKKCPNVPPEVKQEMRQLLEQKNKEKAKRTADIEEICAKLRGTMGGGDRHLVTPQSIPDSFITCFGYNKSKCIFFRNKIMLIIK